MIELLLSCAILLSVELMAATDYNNMLDSLFMKQPEDALLLDLEFASSDIKETIWIIHCYCAEHTVDYSVFGRFLMNGLEKAYACDGVDIEGFAAKAYAIWNMLPSIIQLTKPFEIMCYADDPLSWGDEKRTRELFEKMFRYYDDINPHEAV